MRLKVIVFQLLLLALVIMTVPARVVADQSKTVLIVAASTEEPYKNAVAGFKQQLSLTQKVNYKEIVLALQPDAEKQLISAVKDYQPDLIYSVGGEPTEAAVQSTTSIPIIATMTLKNAAFSKVKNMTGVFLNYPLAIQFEWLKKFFPQQRKIAIFFNPAENGETVQEAKKIAKQNGLDLMSIPVHSPKELPLALDQLKNNVEILLAIPDGVAMSTKTAKEVLLASFRNMVPLVGLSDNWVKSGAFYSLSWDYSDLGKQCGIQADKLFNNTSIQQLPVEYPRKIAYSINTKIAEHMNMEISQTLLKNAKLIFN
jgi:putative ABC transport system substrate-binding protein